MCEIEQKEMLIKPECIKFKQSYPTDQSDTPTSALEIISCVTSAVWGRGLPMVVRQYILLR